MRYLLCAIALCMSCGAVNAANYYVDARSGNDKNSGTSTAKPWRSIDKVNSTEFRAGDSILFHRGSVWQLDEALRPQGSGSKGLPIVISAYGNGPLPVLAGGGFTGAGVVSLHNQSWWTISNLELTNWAAEAGDRRGVEVKGANGGLLEGIHIRNLVIHHIKGIIGQERKAKRTAGVEFNVTHDKSVPTRFNDLLVEGCHMYAIDNQGIVLNNEQYEMNKYPGDETWGARMFTNVVIIDNVIHDISKNAMIVRMTQDGVVEHNLCFRTAYMEHGGNTIFSRNVRGTTFQYNEGFLNRSPDHDGSLYDPDINSPKTIWRYSYSHDNAHGLAWFCTDYRDDGIIVHDNVSEDDHGYLVYFNYSFSDARVFRNMFYAGSSVKPYLLRVNGKNAQLFYSLSKNIVWNQSPSMTFEYPFDGATNPQSVREVKDNLMLGAPVTGCERNEWVDAKSFRKFHRGFLRTNALDTLAGNSVKLFVPSDKPERTVVGEVNGTPVYMDELEREFERNRWQFATAKGTVNNQAAYQAALKEIVFIKVQLAEMAARGMLEADAANDIEGLRKMENDLRKTTSREDVMWFGPRQYDKGLFWDFFFAKAKEELLKKMSQDSITVNEEQMRAHFALGHEPSWPKRGYDYAKKAVKTSLLDKRYAEWFNAKAAAATVTIDNKVMKKLTEK